MKKLLLMFALIFMVTSCDDNMSYMEEMTDLQLIEAIAMIQINLKLMA